eukprot:763854-Hanusia_phi.AAC.3
MLTSLPEGNTLLLFLLSAVSPSTSVLCLPLILVSSLPPLAHRRQMRMDPTLTRASTGLGEYTWSVGWGLGFRGVVMVQPQREGVPARKNPGEGGGGGEERASQWGILWRYLLLVVRLAEARFREGALPYGMINLSYDAVTAAPRTQLGKDPIRDPDRQSHFVSKTMTYSVSDKTEPQVETRRRVDPDGARVTGDRTVRRSLSAP